MWDIYVGGRGGGYLAQGHAEWESNQTISDWWTTALNPEQRVHRPPRHHEWHVWWRVAFREILFFSWTFLLILYCTWNMAFICCPVHRKKKEDDVLHYRNRMVLSPRQSWFSVKGGLQISEKCSYFICCVKAAKHEKISVRQEGEKKKKGNLMWAKKERGGVNISSLQANLIFTSLWSMDLPSSLDGSGVEHEAPLYLTLQWKPWWGEFISILFECKIYTTVHEYASWSRGLYGVRCTSERRRQWSCLAWSRLQSNVKHLSSTARKASRSQRLALFRFPFVSVIHASASVLCMFCFTCHFSFYAIFFDSLTMFSYQKALLPVVTVC